MALQADLVLNTTGYDVALQKSAAKATSTLAAAGQKGGAAFGKGIEQGIGKGKESIAQLGSALSVLSPELGGLVTQASALTGALKAGSAGFTALGPAAVAVAGLTAAVGLGAGAWYAYTADARNAAKTIAEISENARVTAEQVAKLNAAASASRLKEQTLQLEAAAALGFDVAESQARLAAEQRAASVYGEKEASARQRLFQIEKDLGDLRMRMQGATVKETLGLIDRENALVKERKNARASLDEVKATQGEYTKALLEATTATDNNTSSTVARTAAVRDTAAADREWLDAARARLAEREEDAKLWGAIEEARRQDSIRTAEHEEAIAAREAEASKKAADAAVEQALRVEQAKRETGMSILSTVERLSAEEVAARGDAAIGAVILSKAAGASQIAISGAVAAAKALELGPIFGPIAAAFIGGLATIEAGKVLAAPVPEAPSFATGRVPTRAGESFAYVGPDEAVVNPRGVRAAGADMLRDLNKGRAPVTTTTVSLDGARVTGTVGSRMTTDRRESERMIHLASGSLGTYGRAVYR